MVKPGESLLCPGYIKNVLCRTDTLKLRSVKNVKLARNRFYGSFSLYSGHGNSPLINVFFDRIAEEVLIVRVEDEYYNSSVTGLKALMCVADLSPNRFSNSCQTVR